METGQAVRPSFGIATPQGGPRGGNVRKQDKICARIGYRCRLAGCHRWLVRQCGKHGWTSQPWHPSAGWTSQPWQSMLRGSDGSHSPPPRSALRVHLVGGVRPQRIQGWSRTTARRRRRWPRTGSTRPTNACGRDGDDLSQWWTVFNDPVLDNLICCAYHQNLTLREAGCRILEARAQLGIAVGELFPQTQNMTGDYTRNAVSRQIANGQYITPTVLQPMGLRVQPQLGAGLLGPIPPGDRIERREPGRLGGRLR